MRKLNFFAVLWFVIKVHADVHKYEIIWPSGIAIDKQDDAFGNTYRICRLQKNIISLRPQWRETGQRLDVFSALECRGIINRCESFASLDQLGWENSRHIDNYIRPTNHLPLALVFNYTEVEHIKNRLRSTVISALSEQYELDSTKIAFGDLFITKYESQNNYKNRLDRHQDKSAWSFVVVLNIEFDGGGTYFFDRQEMVQPPLGAAVYFSGTRFHAAVKITRGTRYVLAGFCDYSDSSHNSFMETYDPLYDGHAAQAGVRTGDIIVAIQVCRCNTCLSGEDSCVADNNYWMGPVPTQCPSGVIREMMTITGTTSDEQWVKYAQSCELLSPNSPTILIVNRIHEV